MKNLLDRKNDVGSNQYRTKRKGLIGSLKELQADDIHGGLKKGTWITLIIFIIVIAIFAYFGYQDRQHQPGKYISPLPQGAGAYTWSTRPIVKTFEDTRAQKLYTFLVNKNSPLANYADKFVEAADKNALPYNLSVAIACQESGCGRLLSNSYNAWGITTGLGYGPRFRGFADWKEAIEFHAHFLAKEYRSDMIGGIQNRYCPASDNCSRQWTVNVTKFSNEIAER